jgi:hypothetical protein
MTATTDCRYCIDSNMPAGSDPDIGALFERCPACTPVCPDCDGIAVFPATFDCLPCFIVSLLAKQLAPILCPGCLGVVAIIPINLSEVTP